MPLGAVGVAVPVLYLVDPNSTHVPLCPLHAMTGLWCPLCGATRASHALLHGDLTTALHDNALYVLGLPLLVLWWWQLTGTSEHVRIARPVFWTAAVLAAVFTVARNLGVGSLLAPPT